VDTEPRVLHYTPVSGRFVVSPCMAWNLRGDDLVREIPRLLFDKDLADVVLCAVQESTYDASYRTSLHDEEIYYN
jgi:hypothetical protein